MGKIETYRDQGCLVTGASAGIGREVARGLAREGARIVVTARRRERLHELVDELRSLGSSYAEAVVADLADPGAIDGIVTTAEGHLGHVDVLVNNAGFSVPGRFVRTDLQRTLAMVQVNVSASIELAWRLLPGMLERGRGGVLTVSSVAGYQAAPFQSAYAGTKAFLLNWNASVHQEVKHSNVAVTALCPGVTDTEFFEASGYRRLSGFLNRRMPADRVARAGLRALQKGKMEVVPGLTNKMLIFVQRLVPRSFAAAVSRRLMSSRPQPSPKT